MKARILKRQLDAAQKHLDHLRRQGVRPDSSKSRKQVLRTLANLSASLAELRNSAEEVYQLNRQLTGTSLALEAEHEHSMALLEERRVLAARLWTAQEEERRRISRELHDDACQKLALLIVEIETLEQNLPISHLQILAQLRSFRERAAELSDDVRNLAYRLHPSILEDLGLAVALRSFARDFAARERIQVRLIQKKLPRTLPSDIASCIYRVTQEGLRNAARHANTRRILVTLTRSTTGIRLAIRDWGGGFNPDILKGRCGGLGIIGMEERVRLVDGVFQIHSAPGKGTQVVVRLPLAEPAL